MSHIPPPADPSLIPPSHDGSAADRVYQRLGWTRLGVVPAYSTLPDGSLTANVYYYLELD